MELEKNFTGKNILMAADYRTPSSGNFIASLLELADRLRSKDCNTYFLVPYRPNRYSWADWLENNGYMVIYFDENREEGKLLNDLKEIVSRYKIDLVHSHFGYLHKVLVKHRRTLNVEVIFHDHMDYSAEQGIIKQKMRQIIYACLYRIKGIGVISVMEKKSRGYWILGRRRNWYVPNGLSFRRNVEHYASREECRKMLGISPNQKLCLFLGWDIRRKGVDIAVKAIGEYRASALRGGECDTWNCRLWREPLRGATE